MTKLLGQRAYTRKHRDYMISVVRHGVNANSKDKDGRTPLSYAAEKGHIMIVTELLVRYRVEADSKDENGRTPLSYAVEKGHIMIVTKFLVRRDVEADSKDKDGRTLLSYAAEKGHIIIVKKLLDRRHVKADSKDKDGRTPFSYAAERGFDSIMTSLLRRPSVDADSKDKDGRTPLSYAAEKGHIIVVTKLLVRHDVKADSKDKDGRMSLSHAAEKGQSMIVIKLLDRRDVKADSKDKDGRTSLSHAAEKGQSMIVIKLLDRRDVKADSKDKDGRTPLSYAAEMGHESIVKILLERDVVPDSMDKDGHMPLWYANKKKHASIITMLSKGDVIRVANVAVKELGGTLLKQESLTRGIDEKTSIDSKNLMGMDGIVGEVIVLAAVNALDHVDKHASYISQILAGYNIHRGDYTVQTGFKSQLFFNEVGLLEEITILSTIVPKEDNLAHLLDELGKVLSPFPGIFCTKDDIHPIPVFKEGGEKWDVDAYNLMHTKWSPLLSRADIGSNTIFQQHLQVSSHPTGDDMSKGGATLVSGGGTNENGDSGSSKKGKGKEGSDGEKEGDNEKKADPHHGTGDKFYKYEDEESHRVHFDVSAWLCVPNQTPPDRASDAFKIIGTISIPKAEGQAQRLHVAFKLLNFQGLSGSKYTQSSARVAIDAGHPLTRITVKHPHKSAASTKQEIVTNAQEEDFGLGGNIVVGAIQFIKKSLLSGMVQGGPTLSISRTGIEATERTRMLSRITNFQDEGVVWWGFEVDDAYFRQHGIELLEKDLPNVDFEFWGEEPLNLPEHFDVEVTAYWSMPPTKEWFTSREPVIPYYSLCQVVVLKIPRILKKSLGYFERMTADVGHDGKVHIVKGNANNRRFVSDPLEGKTLIEDIQDPKSVQQKSLSESLWEVSHLEIPSLRPCPITNQETTDEWTVIESSPSQEQSGSQFESHPMDQRRS